MPDVDRRAAAGSEVLRDEIAGFWPGVQLAIGMAGVTGLVTLATFAAWLQFGLARPLDGSPLTATASWMAFWLVLSASLLGGLWLSHSCWQAVHAGARHRQVAEETEVGRRVALAAIEAVEALLEDARGARPGDHR